MNATKYADEKPTFRFGMAPDTTRLVTDLRRLAASIESGDYAVQSVNTMQSCDAADFPFSTLTIRYSPFRGAL